MHFVSDENNIKFTAVKDSYDENIQNQHCLHINRLEARSVIVPALKKGVYYRNKEESPFLQSLNGDWDFCYCTGDDEPDFYKTDYDTSSWDTIDVPSMWQYRGYGRCAYPNIEYPIPFNPPFVCCENPVGYYRRSFTVENPAAKTILHFGGVDNAFYVYVNGEFVGFSKGSRIPAEFDVSEYIREGENSISVKVFSYSDATYLENQDMLLANGIFRDVYLMHLGKNSLWDYRVTTTMNSICISAVFDCVENSGCRVRISLDNDLVEYRLEKNICHTFSLENPRLWNAEQPNLYDLTIEILKDGNPVEIHSKRVGIMHTKVIGNKFFVNGSPVYIKGINRHEYDCKNGRAISVSLIEKELKMIKENNLNAIRCSHYTNNPAFYEIASEIGLYVMDEADIETHGAWVRGDQGYLSKQPDWYGAYFDRISRMVAINKNEPCIFIWSLGNECGRGENIDKCFEYVRDFDPTKEVVHTQEEPYYPKYSNFSRTGYKAIADIESFKETGHPLMLIEYAHAMGNSPGFLEGYWDYIYSHDYMCGGFVWEFKNHGFYAEDEKGRDYYLYGGDFEDREKYHWLNFCLDGYLTSNGTPKPTWYELGEVSAPVYVKFDGKLCITNTNDFKPVDYLDLKWELSEDYNVIKSGKMKMPAILPHQTEIFGSESIDYIPDSVVPGAKYYINLYFYDGERKVASRQFLVPTKNLKCKYEKKNFDPEIITDKTNLTVKTADFEAEFADGVIAKYKRHGKLLIDKPMQMSFYHAPNDNDGITADTDWLPTWFGRRKVQWARSFVKTMKFHCEKIEAERKSDEIVITSIGKVIPDFEWHGYETVIEYRVLKDGKILTFIHCKPFGQTPEVMPRMGVLFELPKSFEKVSWYGRGKVQNYPDAKLSAPIGYYESDAQDMNFMFDAPQDTGNRENTSFVNVSDGDGTGISIIGCDEFSFSYHDFSLASLDDAKHKNELEKSENNYLYIDYKVRGLGSCSCGPEPESDFELYPHEFKFAFVISNLQTKDEALEFSRTDFGIKTEKLTDKYVYEKVEEIKQVADCKGDDEDL